MAEEIRAVVSESNGEVSCSVEETNRIRALLGLKPLKLDTKSEEEKALDNFRVLKEKEEREKSTDELRARLEAARNRRLTNQKMAGKKLSDIAKDEEDISSAADWVKRSRAKEENENAKRITAVQMFADEPESTVYDAGNLKGLQVKHSAKTFDDINEGEGIILTLSDTTILKKDGRGRVIEENDEVDMLENSLLTERENREAREKKMKKLKQPVYGGYDDDEFVELGGDGKRRKILAQYDIDKTDFKAAGPALVIGGQGKLVKAGTDGEDREVIVGEKETAPVNPDETSLTISRTVLSDYYSVAEYEATSQTIKKKKKVPKKIRVTDGEEGDDDSYLKHMQVEVVDAVASGDRGSRRKATAVIVEDDNAAAKKLSYYKAIAISQEKNDKVFANVLSEDKGALRVKELIKSAQSLPSVVPVHVPISNAFESIAESHNVIGEDIDVEGRRTDGKLVFNDTTEFSARLRAQLNEDSRARAEKVIKSQEEQEIASLDEALNPERMDNDVSMDEDDHEENNEESLGFMNQPVVRTGLASTLQLLKETNQLVQKEILVGRANDDRSVDPSAGGIFADNKQFNVKLEYRDSTGRKLTQKDAYRQLCYKFHGYGPSKKKIEKRLTDLEKQQAVKRADTSQSKLLNTLSMTQELTGKAGVVISKGNAGV